MSSSDEQEKMEEDQPAQFIDNDSESESEDDDELNEKNIIAEINRLQDEVSLSNDSSQRF